MGVIKNLKEFYRSKLHCRMINELDSNPERNDNANHMTDLSDIYMPPNLDVPTVGELSDEDLLKEAKEAWEKVVLNLTVTTVKTPRMWMRMNHSP